MPAALHPYLNFPGNTREVLEFYGRALGATPAFATFGEFNAVPADSEHAEKIMHGSLEVTDLIRLYAADHVEGMTPRAWWRATVSRCPSWGTTSRPCGPRSHASPRAGP